ncbi:hypothetical protein F0562_030742 [Nyssa sinensis]|uniref:RWP-RK domain-containing protein n=1 Tax=Nyssa sinensis TaxID=561372 RepID=A0A5J5B0P7_9ASTE|nr:hypothetical protein F0562_030742 [Nyssa sinensis]
MVDFDFTSNGGNVARTSQSCTAITHSKKTNTRKKSEKKCSIKQKPITLPDLEPLFDTTRKYAAKKLGVSIATLKRICRQCGILQWPYCEEKGNNCSLTKTKLVIKSAQGVESACIPTYLTTSSLPGAVRSQQNSPGSKPSEYQGEENMSPICKTLLSDGQAEMGGQLLGSSVSSHKELYVLPDVGKGSKRIRKGAGTAKGGVGSGKGTKRIRRGASRGKESSGTPISQVSYQGIQDLTVVDPSVSTHKVLGVADNLSLSDSALSHLNPPIISVSCNAGEHLKQTARGKPEETPQQSIDVIISELYTPLPVGDLPRSSVMMESLVSAARVREAIKNYVVMSYELALAQRYQSIGFSAGFEEARSRVESLIEEQSNLNACVLESKSGLESIKHEIEQSEAQLVDLRSRHQKESLALGETQRKLDCTIQELDDAKICLDGLSLSANHLKKLEKAVEERKKPTLFLVSSFPPLLECICNMSSPMVVVGSSF